MPAVINRNSLELMKLFDTPIMTYVDQDGFHSRMKWIPRFVACRALSSNAAVATPSGTVGDWFHPRLIRSSWTKGTDYEVVGLSQRLTSGTLTVGTWYKIVNYVSGDNFTNVGAPRNATGQWFCATGTTPTKWTNGSTLESHYLGGFWVDMYLCSANDATQASAGSICDGSSGKRNYISAPMKVPICSRNSSTLTIVHFRQYLKSRFDYGGFLEYGQGASYTGWAGKGGLITDAHWFELWLWTRINRWLLRGNTYGFVANNHIPQWHFDPNDIGAIDITLSSAYGASLTGCGNPFWDIPISDFCGNRWEFTDGVRLYNGAIYTAGKTINPFTNYSDGYSHGSFINTGLSISDVTSLGQSIASYRTEAVLKVHGIAASTTTAGQGGFDGQGWGYEPSGEMIATRGGDCRFGARCPGALNFYSTVWDYSWFVGARAVLEP